uniref:Uncharacterized protein n=1 Tax=Arundo donax TaxID=35708 RepID=A0A0A9D8R0_ARUDO
MRGTPAPYALHSLYDSHTSPRTKYGLSCSPSTAPHLHPLAALLEGYCAGTDGVTAATNRWRLLETPASGAGDGTSGAFSWSPAPAADHRGLVRPRWWPRRALAAS